MHASWDDIRTIEALVRTGSLAAAARELSLRHTTVSRRVEALERSLGMQLFLRGARLRPTPMALSIAERASEMRSRAHEIEGLVERERRRGEGRLVVTTNEVLSPLLFGALRAAALDVQVDVVVTDIERELEPGVTDLALRPSFAPGGSLRGQSLGRLRLGIYRTRHAREEWILPSESLRSRASMRWWSAIPDDASSRLTCDSLFAMREACVAGLGRCVIPSFLAEGDSRLERVREVEGGTPVWLLSPPARGSSPSMRALAAALRAIPGAWA
ncbi:LysR family transcriptional regulator [Vulgatibacter incomptus]|uniref:Transcriptional regulator, LysR family n=1 Tax=Vulgatibacter incomptus TaxID=1391653 RepID=A0A0K1PGP9_9BACT|nr:LysR family transcriptional regulator [Vulgatibacter incomptus]AKU92700.1 transcriptional regulator, LysR family [Vulgatibacter incomptus]